MRPTKRSRWSQSGCGRSGCPGETGNRISTVFVDLPVTEPAPEARIAAVAAQTPELKDSAAVQAGALLVGAFAPPLLSGLLARAMGSVRAFNLVVSNLPGPQMPFYLDGVPLPAVYPVVPVTSTPAGRGRDALRGGCPA